MEAVLTELVASCWEAWRPPRRMTLSEWSDEHAFLSAESAAEPGRWHTLPYQRAMMDAMTDPLIEIVVVIKSARVGYTKCLNNLIGYHVHQDACPIMLVQPTIEDAEGYSKEEIAPMIRDTPALAGLVSDPKSKDSGNTILAKQFPGGTLSMVGANSPRGFRRVSRRVVLFDEVDGYPPSAGDEGDQIRLGMRRAEYYHNRKIVIGSTPTDKATSRVAPWFEQSDQRRYFVPCPHCGEMQYLKWANIRWPAGEPQKAVYVCEHHGCIIDHGEKFGMVENGEWRATATPHRPGLAGFHIWAAYSYSPNATWGQLAQEFIDAKGDTLKLKTFVNTVLGETWEDKGERVDPTGLIQRAKLYPYSIEPLPAGVLAITIGGDTQPNRLEAEVVGWGVGEESWSLGYYVFHGDPNADLVWQQLDMLMMREYEHPAGVRLRAIRTFIDAMGSNTEAVYRATRARLHMGLMPCRGVGGDGVPAVRPPSAKIGAQNDRPWLVGGNIITDQIYGRLKLDEPGAGFMHLNPAAGLGYFEGLTAEESRVRYTKGHPVREYHLPHGRRNEPLDCRKYAYAAFLSLNLNLEQMQEIIDGTYEAPQQGRRVRGEMAAA